MTLDPHIIWKPGRRDRHLAVHTGVLWITGPNRSDLIVEAGTSLTLTGSGWVIEALGGTPCDFTTSMSSPTSPSRATPSRFSSKKAG